MTDKAETELKASAFDIFKRGWKLGQFAQGRAGAGDEIDFWYSDEQADLREQAAALSRPTQTADAVEALKDVLSAYTEYDQRLCCDGRECGCEAATLFEAIEHYFKAALSTSADSGDQEEVEPVAWMFIGTSGVPFWTLESGQAEKWRRLGWKETPLYAHSPTLQDSGLADELYAILKDALGADTHGRVPQDLLQRTITALRQPRNDGDLLREFAEAFAPLGVVDYHSRELTETMASDEWADDDRIGPQFERFKAAYAALDETGFFDTALARLDQGEG